MQKKSLKKFYPSLMPQAIPQISVSQGQVLPTLPPDFEKRKVDAGISTTHECGDEKEFSQKAIISRLQASPLDRSDDGEP